MTSPLLVGVDDQFNLPPQTRAAEQAAMDLAVATLHAQTRLVLARDPMSLLEGTRTVNTSGAVTQGVVRWPDGVTGSFTGTPDPSFPALLRSWTITYQGSPGRIYTQPAITRNAQGFPTNMPAVTVANA